MTLSQLLLSASLRLPPRGVRRLVLTHAGRRVGGLGNLTAQLPGFVEVELSGCGCALAGLGALLSPLPALSSVSLSRCGLGGGGAAGGAGALAPLAFAGASLTELRLSFVALGPEGLAGLSALPRLRRLALRGVRQPRLQLRHVSALGSLEDLEISGVETAPLLEGAGGEGGLQAAGGQGPHGGDLGGVGDLGVAAGLVADEEGAEGAVAAEQPPAVQLAGAAGGGGTGPEAAHLDDLAAALSRLRGLRRLRVRRLRGTGGAVEGALAELSALTSLALEDADLADGALPLCWAAWACGLVELKVRSFCYARPWPGPPLAALTRLEAAGAFRAPERFLGGFAPNLGLLDVGGIDWGRGPPAAGFSFGTAGDGCGLHTLRPPPPPPPSPTLTMEQEGDRAALLLRLTRCSSLHLAHLGSRRLAGVLPHALCLWTGLRELSLERVTSGLDDTALRLLLAPHASTLEALSLVGCRGVTWRGVRALGALQRLRRLRLAHQYEVTTASVIAAARACGLTELHLSDLFASCSCHGGASWRAHAADAFALGAH
ncbi:hypothetical protein MNEG_4462 [Monoraphidium neglectum]|uniref:Uncharacterized protein n=1 Tax=Monoraphidium neglectum TaxID=145388 RepID=A0A0D2MKN9_9CHLO|nr:hypothetical protein MNEG_4462 [Monoraphidium neglectum]KIZ03500.1 hypothetical protein MNEG_4462 [Monoraphidium neglectum]|eukprot:XP_013902519.1 hypothetical protein MNEG_4462 [Monoraphidium neglectum]